MPEVEERQRIELRKCPHGHADKCSIMAQVIRQFNGGSVVPVFFREGPEGDPIRLEVIRGCARNWAGKYLELKITMLCRGCESQRLEYEDSGETER